MREEDSLTNVRLAGAAAALGACFALSPTLTSPAWADVPKARIEGVTDDALRERLTLAVGVSADPPASRFEARRRARDAAEDAVKSLRSEGYYGHVVEPDVSDGETPEAVLRITPGPRFVFGDTAIAWQGDPPAGEARTAALAVTGLARGAPGRAETVVEAEGRTIAALTARGYADARVTPREVIVDHATGTVQPTYKLAAGPLVKLNGVQLGTVGRTDPEWIVSLAPWTPGEVYNPDDVAELERRLLDTGVYDTVTVALAPPAQTTADGLRPIVVSLADRPRRTLEIGAGYSSSEGVGFEAEYARYNQFGRADTLRLLTVLAQIERRLQAELSLPHFRQPGRTLRLGAEAFQDETNAYDETGLGVRADIERRIGKTTYFNYGLRLDISQTAEQGQERNFAALTGLGGFSLDRSSDPLDPVNGWRIESRVEPTVLTGDSSLAFLRANTQVSAYLPFGEEQQTGARRPGSSGRDRRWRNPAVPAGRRFYAGGGGSVRGYEFQAIGPRYADGTPRGGLSLLEGSLELRRRSFGDAGIRRALGGVVVHRRGHGRRGRDPGHGRAEGGGGFGVRFDVGFAPIPGRPRVPAQQGGGRVALPDLPQHRAGVLTDASIQTAPVARRRRRTGRRVAVGLLVVLALLVALAVAGALTIRTGRGRSSGCARSPTCWTASASAGSGRLEVSGVKGDVFGDFTGRALRHRRSRRRLARGSRRARGLEPARAAQPPLPRRAD
jgi:translocation and assembly module TamA